MEEQENKLGRPSKYKEEYNEQVYKLCLLGATDKEIGDFFNVTETTINNWKIEFPSFFESIKIGKVEADYKVVESLYKKATGFTIKETQLAQFQGMFTDEKTIEKELPPDTTAAIFWLKNRQPDKWRDKQEMKLDGSMQLDIKPITWVDSNNETSE